MCRVPRGSRGGEAAGDLSMGLVVEVRDGFPEETMSQLILPSRAYMLSDTGLVEMIIVILGKKSHGISGILRKLRDHRFHFLIS